MATSIVGLVGVDADLARTPHSGLVTRPARQELVAAARVVTCPDEPDEGDEDSVAVVAAGGGTLARDRESHICF